MHHACFCKIIKQILDKVKQRFQIFGKILKYSQATQIDIVYIAIGLHNFIKSNFENEKDIYYIPINIFDDTDSNGDKLIIQSSLVQMNKLIDKTVAEMWENYQIYLAQ